jgi:hypothetical protein
MEMEMEKEKKKKQQPILRKRSGPRIYFLRRESIAMFHAHLPVFINGRLFTRHASHAVPPHRD